MQQQQLQQQQQQQGQQQPGAAQPAAGAAAVQAPVRRPSGKVLVFSDSEDDSSSEDE
jgi:hypothetical protein